MFQQTIGISMGDLFLHAYEADIFQGILKNKDSRFGDHLRDIYPNEL
jgi:hypothetical protein